MELSHDLWDAAGAAKWGQDANLLLATGTEMVPMETQGLGKILRLLSGWEESVWERSAQGPRSGLAVWKLESWWVSAQPLYTVKSVFCGRGHSSTALPYVLLWLKGASWDA